jgi:outer membrane receptor protein involved in Fe transport
LGGGKAFRVEAYDTNQDRIPVPNDLLNYTNDGVGMARGVEFMARQAPTSRLFGWLAYSYSQSKRRNGEGRNWYPYEYDNGTSVRWS